MTELEGISKIIEQKDILLRELCGKSKFKLELNALSQIKTEIEGVSKIGLGV